MRIGPKTAVAMLSVATLPLALGSISAIRLADHALRQRVSHHHDAVARFLAGKLRDDIATRRAAISHAAEMYLFEAMTPQERLGALRLVFRQIDWASVVILLDAAGEAVADPVFLPEAPEKGELAEREPTPPRDLEAFAEHIQLSAARSLGAAMSPPYLDSRGVPRLSVSVRSGDNHVLAVELALRPLVQTVAREWLGPAGRTLVVDSNGRVVLDSQGLAGDAMRGRDLSRWSPVQSSLAGASISGGFSHRDLGRVLGAVTPVPGYRWGVVVMEPESSALDVPRTLRWASIRWSLLALATGLGLGLFSARTLTGPVRAIHAGAIAVGGGQFDHRVAGSERRDELGDLSRAFNRMADEIQRWNTELEDRVEHKSRQLREAQELLLRTQKMAAVGQLGAGVAHEINNPLAALMAATQLIMRTEPEDSRSRRALAVIRDQAERIRVIVDELRLLVEQDQNAGAETVDLCDTVERSAEAVRDSLEHRGIDLVLKLAEDRPKVLGSEAALREAFGQLFDNARLAMADGGVLTVEVARIAEQLTSVRVQDTGPGIPDDIKPRIFEPFFTTKTHWESKGLGLSIVSKVVTDHQGEIRVESEESRGAVFTVMLPAKATRILT